MKLMIHNEILFIRFRNLSGMEKNVFSLVEIIYPAGILTFFE